MRTTLLAATVMLATSGCSMLFMERLPERHNPKAQPYCTATRGFVTWDAALALVHTASLVANVYIASQDQFGDATSANKVIAIVDAFGVVGHIASATDGGRQAERCARAREAYETNRAGVGQ